MKNHVTNISKLEAAMDAMKLAMAGAHERLTEGLQLTRTQIQILKMLADAPQTTSKLASRLFLTQSAVTQTIDTLFRRELIERHTDEADRRLIQLHLSPAGLRITDHLQSLRKTYFEALANELTDDEMAVFIKVSEKIAAQINATQTKPKHI
jgi:DNA-binding MarR family transcriptional regulator